MASKMFEKGLKTRKSVLGDAFEVVGKTLFEAGRETGDLG